MIFKESATTASPRGRSGGQKKRSATTPSSLRSLVLSLILIGHGVSAAAQERLAATSSEDRERTIVVGRIHEDARTHYPRVERMAAYLAQHLHNLGITRGGVLITKNVLEMISHVKGGRVDILSETPFSALRLREKAGAEIVLKEWKGGVDFYRSVFFARTDRGIDTLQDLRDRKIAFEDPGSTSAFLVPLAILRAQGLEPIRLSSPRESPPPGKVGYVFTYGELNQATWVARGVFDAGAFSDLDWAEINRTPEPMKKQLKIFYRGGPVLRSVLLMRGDLKPAVRAKVKSILLTMHGDEEGRATLEVYNRVKRYDEIDDEAISSLDEISRLAERIRTEID